MNVLRVIAGFAFSILAGHIVLWSLIERCLWPYVRKNHPPDPDHHKSRLSWMVGVLERTIYTGALMLPGSGIQLIAGFLAVKVAARWHSSSGSRATADSDNIWIIGTWLSVLFGVVGAWIALGHIPALANIKSINPVQ
ncbi:MAG TPA: hypothetical protein VF865_19270 [Acidobacteriaceae bacterium]